MQSKGFKIVVNQVPDVTEDRNALNRYHRCLGNGYHGKSQSQNARIARKLGCRPLSGWSKHNLMEEIAAVNPDRADLFKAIQEHVLRIYFLKHKGYHHTSCCFNETNFYSLNETLVRSIPSSRLHEMSQIRPYKWQGKMFRNELRFLEWPKDSDYCFRHGIRPARRTFRDVTVEADDNQLCIKSKYGRVIALKENPWPTVKILPDPRRLVSDDVCRFLGIPQTSYEMFRVDKTRFDTLGDQMICPKGRKPRQADYANGLGNFFIPGEKRVGKNRFGYYQLEEWNGGWWVPAENRDAA